MSKSGGRFEKSRYNDDGLRVGKSSSHSQHINEKHMKCALKSKSFAIVEDEEDDLDPHWLFQEGD
jgi:hypothetical protein